jgi:hypothetical protein
MANRASMISPPSQLHCSKPSDWCEPWLGLLQHKQHTSIALQRWRRFRHTRVAHRTRLLFRMGRLSMLRVRRGATGEAASSAISSNSRETVDKTIDFAMETAWDSVTVPRPGAAIIALWCVLAADLHGRVTPRQGSQPTTAPGWASLSRNR